MIAPEEKERLSVEPGHERSKPEAHLNGGGEIGGKFLNGHEDDVDSSFESRAPTRVSSANGENLIGRNMTAGSPNGGETLPYVLSKIFYF